MIISCPSCGASFNIKPEALGSTGRMVKCSKCAHRWRATPEGLVQDEQPIALQADLQEERSPPPEAPEPEMPAFGAVPGEQEHAALAEQIAGSGSESVSPEPAAGPIPSLRLRDALGADAADVPPEPDTKSRSGRKPRPGPRKPRNSTAKIISLFALILLISGVASIAVLMQQKVMMWLPATQRLYALAGIEPEVLGKGLQIVEPKPQKEIDGNDEILVVEGEVRNTAGITIDVPLMRGALLDKTGQELHSWTFTAAKPRIEPGETARYRTEFRNPPADADRLDITFTRSAERAQQVDAQSR